jgi:hypothetical protein
MRPSCSDGRRSWRDGGRTWTGKPRWGGRPWPTREPSRCFECCGRTRTQGAKVKPVKSLVEMMNDDVVPTVSGVTRRVTRSQTRAGKSAAVRETSVGEDVIFCKLIRDGALRHLNPWKLSDLQCVLEMRCFKGLLSDEDLKEVYFQRMWGFKERDFVLAGWREMSVEEMKEAVCEAHPVIDGGYAFPPSKVSMNTLKTKEDILRAYPELTYVPAEVYMTAVGGLYVLDFFPGVDWGKFPRVEGDPKQVNEYLRWACCADLDKDMIRGLAGACDERGIDEAARAVAMSGHIDVLDFLASELGAYIHVECMAGAAVAGMNSMIDHLFETYGLCPYESNRFGCSALQNAVMGGHLRTVKHLVEKYDVDIHARDLDWEEEVEEDVYGSECMEYLRSLHSSNSSSE